MAAPRLRVVATTVADVTGDDVVFRIGFINDGRDDIPSSTVNVVVPSTVKSLSRCNPQGVPKAEGGVYTTDESIATDDDGTPLPSRYWAGVVNFPGRVARPVHFRATIRPTRSFPVLVHVTAPQLDHPFEQRVTVEVTPDVPRSD
jgi:hypothetical protein